MVALWIAIAILAIIVIYLKYKTEVLEQRLTTTSVYTKDECFRMVNALPTRKEIEQYVAHEVDRLFNRKLASFQVIAGELSREHNMLADRFFTLLRYLKLKIKPNPEKPAIKMPEPFIVEKVNPKGGK